MRMWCVDTGKMCRQHLLGEHRECHTFMGTFKKGISVDGYIDNGLLDFNQLYNRHEELVKEMEKRGYKHKSPLVELKWPYDPNNTGSVDVTANEIELHNRCKNCKF